MMNRISLLAIVVALALTGCAQIHSVNPNHEPNPSFATINAFGARKTATVQLADGRTFKARSLQATRDSTSWFNAETGHLETVPTAQIDEILFLSRGGGAIGGMGFGLMTGALIGVAVGGGGGSDSDFFPKSETIRMGVVLLGGLGAMVGVVAGAAVGSKAIYRFEAPALPPPVVTEDLRQQRPKRE